MHLRGVIAGGVVGALAITVALFIVRRAGLTEMSVEMMLGAMLTRRVDAATWALGLGMHLVMGVIFALAYAAVFQKWCKAGPLCGVTISLPHIMLAGFLLLVLPAVHPAMPEHPQLPAPGFLGIRYGAVAAIAYALGHVAYGAIVGALYLPFSVGWPPRRPIPA